MRATVPGTCWLGPLTPGVGGTQSNTQCTLNAGASSVSGSGNALTVKVALSFTAAFAGLKNVYGYAVDNGNLNSGWKVLGTWNTGVPVAPTADSLSPNAGAGTTQTFSRATTERSTASPVRLRTSHPPVNIVPRTP